MVLKGIHDYSARAQLLRHALRRRVEAEPAAAGGATGVPGDDSTTTDTRVGGAGGAGGTGGAGGARRATRRRTAPAAAAVVALRDAAVELGEDAGGLTGAADAPGTDSTALPGQSLRTAL